MDEKKVIDSVNEQKFKAQKAKGFSKNSIATSTSIRIKDVASVAESESNETPSEQPAETPKEEPKPAQQDSITLDSLKTILQQTIDPLKSQISEVTSQNSALQSELDATKNALEQTKEELEQAKKTAKTLDDLSKLIGSPVTAKPEMPMVNTVAAIDDSPKGIAKEFVGLMESVQSVRNVGAQGGTTGQIYATQRDHAPINKFIQRHFAEERASGRSWRDSALVRDLESWFKANGMLNGGKNINATTGPSTGGSMPNLFLDVLSALMRETHNSTNIFWQFPTTVYDPTSAPSKNVLVPRFNYLGEPTAVSDFLIADYSTFNPIGLTVGNTSDSQALEATTVPIGIAQYGLGRGGSTATRPVFIPEFHEATSLVDLMMAADTRLMQNYYRFEELLIRTQYEAATTIVYNDGGLVTDDATDINTADNGTMTRDFCHALYSSMFAAKIPALPDGCYILALNPTAATQLQISLGEQYRPVTEDQMRQVTSTFRMATGIEIGRATQYFGLYCNFHIFVSNSFGVGAAGASATVNEITLGGALGDKVAVDSFAFGIGTVGRGVALPMEIRSQGSPFDLGTAFIWVSREGVGALDLDSSLASSQQTRCWKVRTLLAAV